MDPKYIQPSDNSSMQVEPPAVGGPIVGAGQSVDYRPYVTSIKNQGCLFGNNITIPETLPSYRGLPKKKICSNFDEKNKSP